MSMILNFKLKKIKFCLISSISVEDCISNNEYICSLCKDSCNGIVATSFPFIYGPQEDIDNLNLQLGFSDDGSLDCSLISSLPSNIYFYS
jgi:hypothetical protein